MKEKENSPENTASAVIDQFATTTIATPTIKPKRHGKQHPRRLKCGQYVRWACCYAITSDVKDIHKNRT